MKILNKNLEVEISQVKEWQDNPRDIKPDDLERLKKQLKKFGQYKSLICVKENGVYTTLAGNMRLRAMTELGFKTAWITEIEVKDEAEKIEISLSDNDRAVYYLQDELAFQLRDVKINLEDYKVDLRIPDVNLQDILDRNIQGSDKDDEVPDTRKTDIKTGALLLHAKRQAGYAMAWRLTLYIVK
jgi:hypothetical protein